MKPSFFILLAFLVNMNVSAVPVAVEKSDSKTSTYYVACNCGCKDKPKKG